MFDNPNPLKNAEFMPQLESSHAASAFTAIRLVNGIPKMSYS